VTNKIGRTMRGGEEPPFEITVSDIKGQYGSKQEGLTASVESDTVKSPTLWTGFGGVDFWRDINQAKWIAFILCLSTFIMNFPGNMLSGWNKKIMALVSDTWVGENVYTLCLYTEYTGIAVKVILIFFLDMLRRKVMVPAGIIAMGFGTLLYAYGMHLEFTDSLTVGNATVITAQIFLAIALPAKSLIFPLWKKEIIPSKVRGSLTLAVNVTEQMAYLIANAVSTVMITANHSVLMLCCTAAGLFASALILIFAPASILPETQGKPLNDNAEETDDDDRFANEQTTLLKS